MCLLPQQSFVSHISQIQNFGADFQQSLSLQELEEFWVYKALLTELTKQLTYCVRTELIPLMEVAGVLEVSKPGWMKLFNVNSCAKCYCAFHVCLEDQADLLLGIQHNSADIPQQSGGWGKSDLWRKWQLEPMFFFWLLPQQL